MKRIFIFLLSFLMMFVGIANAIEVVRQKNVATYIVVPIVDADGDAVTSAAGLDSEIDVFADGTAPDGFADCTNEATEIGSTGQYYLSLSQSEMNNDYIIIQIKTSTSGAKTQTVLIRTMTGDPLLASTSTNGTAIDVESGGTVGVDLSNINGTLDAAEIGSGAITSAKFASGAIDATAIAADAIGASEIADNAIDAGAIATDAIGSAEIAADAIGASEIATDAIGAAEIAANALTTAEIATGAISADEIADNAIDAGAIAADAITAAKIAASAITSSEFAQSAADLVWSTAARSLTILDEDSTTLDLNGTTVGGLTTWDKTGYSIADSTSDSVIADAVWNAATASYGAASTYGALVETNIDATISSRGTSTLTVSDNIGINWADVSNPTTSVNLSGTTISTSQAVASVSGAVGSVTGGVTVTTNNDKSGYALSSAGVTAVWDKDISGYSTAGLAGTYLKGAGSAGDPWVTSLPGSYTAGQAGYIIGTNLNTTVSSRSSHSAADVWSSVTRTLTALDEDSTTLDLNGTAIGSVTNGVTVTTNNDKTGYSLTQSFPTNFSSLAITAGGAVTAGTVSDKTGYTVSTVSDKTGYSLSSSQTFNLTGNITGNLSGSVGSVTGAVGSVTGAVTVGTNNDKAGYSISGTKTTLDSLNDITTASVWANSTRTLTSGAYSGLTAADIDAIWDELIAGHLTEGTTGAKLNSAASAGDPWSTDISSGYTGQAGEYLRNIKDATDGDKESGVYTGIESMIRINR